MDEVIKIEIPRQQDNGFVYIHLDKDKTIQISRDTLLSLTMGDLLKRIEKIDKTLNEEDIEPKVSISKEEEPKKDEKDELEEWVKRVKDQMLDAKVVSMENQNNNYMYKFSLISSQFYSFNDILWRVTKRHAKLSVDFVSNYNFYLNKILDSLNEDLKDYKVSLHLVDTQIVNDYTATHLGEPKVTMYCFADLPKQTKEITSYSSECYVKIYNYENYGQYGHTVTLRELIRLLTNSEDSKINRFWEEQKLSKVMKGRLKNGENEEWEYRC